MKKTAFFNVSDFPKLSNLSQHWKVIQKELFTLHTEIMPIDRVGKNHDMLIAEISAKLARGEKYGWVLGDGRPGGNTDWIQYAIILHDEPLGDVDIFLPETLALLKEIPGIKVCAFSTLKAQSFLQLHSHPEIHSEGLLQFHLTLDTSENQNFAYLNVGGDFHHHQNGVPLVFDGSIEHFAVNASPLPRTILYMEFDRQKNISG